MDTKKPNTSDENLGAISRDADIFIKWDFSKCTVAGKFETQWGSNRVFSYAVQTTYGTNISIEASPNVITKAEAVLNIKEDSVIQNTAGDIGGETGATIVTTPTGTTANLTGITVNNNFILDEGQFLHIG